MISCVICSRDKSLLHGVSLNIQQTIGVEHEIIGIDNSDGKFGICKVYNKGLAAAKYDCLVFVHEDVVFQTAGWGHFLINTFNSKQDIGCLSIAGGIYKTKAPSHWVSLVKEYAFLDISYLVQHYKDGTQVLRDTWPDKTKNLQQTVFVDGVFIAINKKTGIMFDEAVEGFHGYDLAVSLSAINKGFKNFVTREILLEHLSSGSFNNKWVEAIHHFHLKNSNQFPLSATKMEINKADLENKTLARFIELAFVEKENKIGLYWWKKFFFRKPFSSKHIYLAKLYCWNLRLNNKA